jgi:hypothetical protein
VQPGSLRVSSAASILQVDSIILKAFLNFGEQFFIDKRLTELINIMGFKIAYLWQAPDINPINHKARSIPILNPFNVYGRVFLFGWWGFMVAFWSW